jgi:hypothetical protein
LFTHVYAARTPGGVPGLHPDQTGRVPTRGAVFLATRYDDFVAGVEVDDSVALIAATEQLSAININPIVINFFIFIVITI